MGFTLSFVRLFAIGLFYISPVLITLLVLMVTAGLFVGRREGWSRIDSIYYTFVTATTVGYGDFRPKKVLSKMSAITIAFLGLIFTGIVVAVALNAATMTFKSRGHLKGYDELREELKQCRKAKAAVEAAGKQQHDER
jgi:voltage-gated potassium channel